MSVSLSTHYRIHLCGKVRLYQRVSSCPRKSISSFYLNDHTQHPSSKAQELHGFAGTQAQAARDDSLAVTV